jgi:hypothetical protein
VVPKTAIMSLKKRLEHTSLFRRAGMRAKVYFASDNVEAAIVTCGGLCPGINTVIREIVHTLWCALAHSASHAFMHTVRLE